MPITAMLIADVCDADLAGSMLGQALRKSVTVADLMWGVSDGR